MCHQSSVKRRVRAQSSDMEQNDQTEKTTENQFAIYFTNLVDNDR